MAPMLRVLPWPSACSALACRYRVAPLTNTIIRSGAPEVITTSRETIIWPISFGTIDGSFGATAGTIGASSGIATGRAR